AAVGGLTVVQSGRLQEVSVLPLGADSSTSVSIAAKGQSMDTEATIDTTPPADPIVAERARIKAIRDTCAGQYPEIEASAIDSGRDISTLKATLYDAPERQAKLEALRASRPSAAAFGPAIQGGGRGQTFDARDQITAACMLMSGHGDILAKQPGIGERLANS